MYFTESLVVKHCFYNENLIIFYHHKNQIGLNTRVPILSADLEVNLTTYITVVSSRVQQKFPDIFVSYVF